MVRSDERHARPTQQVGDRPSLQGVLPGSERIAERKAAGL